jgi:hypothetical protein
MHSSLAQAQERLTLQVIEYKLKKKMIFNVMWLELKPGYKLKSF